MNAIVWFLAGWFGQSGSGHKTTEARSLSGFTRVMALGAIDVEIGEGDSYAVYVFIDDNLQRFICTEVKEGTLVIDEKDRLRWHGKGKVSVTLPKLERAETKGSSDLQVATRNAHDLALKTSGSGEVSFSGSVKNLRADSSGSGDFELVIFERAESVHLSSSGSGDINIEGSASRLDALSSGSGDIDAHKLQVARAEASSSGSGNLHVFANEALGKIDLSGSGDLILSGGAKIVEQSVSGSGEIRRH